MVSSFVTHPYICHVKDMPTKLQKTRLMKYYMFTAEDRFWTLVKISTPHKPDLFFFYQAVTVLWHIVQWLQGYNVLFVFDEADSFIIIVRPLGFFSARMIWEHIMRNVSSLFDHTKKVSGVQCCFETHWLSLNRRKQLKHSRVIHSENEI